MTTPEALNTLVSEKTYPVKLIFVIKSTFYTLVLLLLFLSYDTFNSFQDTGLYYAITPSVIILYVVFALIQRASFHYLVDDKYLIIKQGVLSKQEKHIPYGVIQNIIVKQDIFDRLFGVSSLIIENAAVGAGSQSGVKKLFGMQLTNNKKEQIGSIGFTGNKVSIPGLAKDHAEKLKAIILQKMKENPADDSHSGL